MQGSRLGRIARIIRKARIPRFLRRNENGRLYCSARESRSRIPRIPRIWRIPKSDKKDKISRLVRASGGSADSQELHEWIDDILFISVSDRQAQSSPSLQDDLKLLCRIRFAKPCARGNVSTSWISSFLFYSRNTQLCFLTLFAVTLHQS